MLMFVFNSNSAQDKLNLFSNIEIKCNTSTLEKESVHRTK